VSLVFHRPQSAGELLDVSLGVVKRHAGFLFRLGIWPVLGIAVIDLVSRGLPEDSTLGLVMLPLSFAVYGLGEAGVSFAAWRLLNRQPVDAGAVWVRVRQRFGSVAVGYTLKWLGVILGLLFFLVPGAMLLVRWFGVPAANVIEGVGIRQGFRRSRELARGNRGQIFVTVGLLDVGATVGSILLASAAMDETTSELPIWFSFASWAFTMFYLLYHAVLSAALYANARVRNEGYDVEDLLAAPTGATR
jgi:hypothetical protein